MNSETVSSASVGTIPLDQNQTIYVFIYSYIVWIQEEKDQHSWQGSGIMKCHCWRNARVAVSGVRQWQAGVPGDGADARRGVAGSHPQAEVLFRARGQRRASHHHKDCGVPPLAGGECD